MNKKNINGMVSNILYAVMITLLIILIIQTNKEKVAYEQCNMKIMEQMGLINTQTLNQKTNLNITEQLQIIGGENGKKNTNSNK